MGKVAESDWKLFKELPQNGKKAIWKCPSAIIEILNGGSEASSRF